MHPQVNSPRLLRTHDFVGDTLALIQAAAKESIATRGLFRFGLAGGNTPRTVYEALAASSDLIPWDKTQITFGDERCVAPEDPASNYGMAKESLFKKIPIPHGNIFRIRGEIDPIQAAAEYEAQLDAVAARFGETLYAHDLLLLGLGEDGHTASLFPGSPALDETQRAVIPATGPKPPPKRVSFTFPLINASRQIAFLVNDPSKEQVIQEVLQGLHPAAKVRPVQGMITWIIGRK